MAPSIIPSARRFDPRGERSGQTRKSNQPTVAALEARIAALEAEIERLRGLPQPSAVVAELTAEAAKPAAASPPPKKTREQLILIDEAAARDFAKMDAVNAGVREAMAKEMTRPGLKFEPQPSRPGEVWRPYAGGGNPGFYWGGVSS